MYLREFCKKYNITHSIFRKKILDGEFNDYVSFAKHGKITWVKVDELRLIQLLKGFENIKGLDGFENISFEESGLNSKLNNIDSNLNKKTKIDEEVIDSIDQVLASDLIKLEKASKILYTSRKNKQFDKKYIKVSEVEEKFYDFCNFVNQRISIIVNDAYVLHRKFKKEDEIKDFFKEELQKVVDEIKIKLIDKIKSLEETE